MNPSDAVRTPFEVKFYLIDPLYRATYERYGEAVFRETKIKEGIEAGEFNFDSVARDRYLYIFSSSDSLAYGIDKQSPGWASRTDVTLGHQHTATLANDASNPKKSNAPPPAVVETEVYCDVDGRMWPLDIRQTWKKPRRQRPHPKWEDKLPESDGEAGERHRAMRDEGKVGRDWLKLSLVTPDLKPKRFYFYLSPIRLGPNGLRAAIEEIGTDGLTLWTDRAAAEKDGVLRASDPESFWRDQIRFKCISLVDPYYFGRKVCEELLERVLNNYLAFISNVDQKRIPGVDDEHFDDKKNEGTLHDLHFMATILEGLASHDESVKKNLDESRLDQILGYYGWRLQVRGNACEAAARFLGNWMAGPAHRILDTTVVKDLEDNDDPWAARDKAAALAYWHSQVRFMPNTISGAAFLTQVLSDDDKGPNPIRDLVLKKFEAPNHPLDERSTTGKALQLLGAIVPDLVLLGQFRIKPEYLKKGGVPDPEKADLKAKALANVMNNLGYFDVKVEAKPLKTPATTLKKEWSSKAKHEVKGAIALVDVAVKAVDSGRIRDFYMRRGLARIGGEFANDELKRITKFDSLGDYLMRLQRSAELAGDRAGHAAEAAEEANAQVRQLEKELKSFQPTTEADRRLLNRYDELQHESKQLGSANDLEREAGEAQSRYRWLMGQPRPEEPTARAARQAQESDAQQAWVAKQQKLDRARKVETELKELEAKVPAARHDLYLAEQWAVLKERRGVLPGQIERAEKDLSSLRNKVRQLGTKSVGDPAEKAAHMVEYRAAQDKLILKTQELQRLKANLGEVDGKLREVEQALPQRQRMSNFVQEAKKALAVDERSAVEAADKLRVVEKQRDALVDMRDELEEFAEDAKKTAAGTKSKVVRPANLWVSIATIGVEAYFFHSVMSDANASGEDRAWAAMDFGKAFADVAKDVFKVNGAVDIKRIAGASAWRQTTTALSVKTPGPATPNVLGPASGLMTWAAVIGGVYNVGKYGIKGMDAVKMSDVSVAVGSGIAVLGGILTVTSALGFALPFTTALTASGVGTLAGLLVITGALIVAYTADSEWEKFAEWCYFAKDKDARNWRPLSPTTFGSDSEHYLGKVESPERRVQKGIVSKQCKWGVRAQRQTLERLLTRFSTYSMVGCGDWATRLPRDGTGGGSWPMKFSATFMIDFQYVPVGSSLSILIERRHLEQDDNWQDVKIFSVTSSQMDSGAKKIGGDLLGCYASHSGPGWIICMIRETPVPRFDKLRANVRLTLPGKMGSIVHIHPMVELKDLEDTTFAGHVIRRWMDENSYPGFADKFRDVSDEIWSPAPDA